MEHRILSAGKAHLTQVHEAHPALSLVTQSVDCMYLLHISLQSSSLLLSNLTAKICAGPIIMALGTHKVGRWSRKPGGHCIPCSFCVELSVHGKMVIKGKLNAKNKYGLSEGELGTDSDELCFEPIREEELCQIS